MFFDVFVHFFGNFFFFTVSLLFSKKRNPKVLFLMNVTKKKIL